MQLKIASFHLREVAVEVEIKSYNAF